MLLTRNGNRKNGCSRPGSKVHGESQPAVEIMIGRSRGKFGTDVMRISIMEYADQLGLGAYGVSFHVGSQNYNVNS